jgi:hypothetical protein
MPLLTELGLAQQKDYLCGPFHAARMLRDHGIDIDQDAVALRAGTSVASDGEVPPGATSYRDYRCELSQAQPGRAGTSAHGLAAAVQELSEGRLVCVPLSGRWSARTVEGLFDLNARLIANLRTGLLWGSRPPVEKLLAALEGTEVPDAPPAEWDVGHFVELVQLLRGRGGSLVVVHDSYPSLGYDGIHLQPPAALAGALQRGDGRQGGVLAVVEPDRRMAVEDAARGLGLKTEMWDN